MMLQADTKTHEIQGPLHLVTIAGHFDELVVDLKELARANGIPLDAILVSGWVNAAEKRYSMTYIVGYEAKS